MTESCLPPHEDGGGRCCLATILVQPGGERSEEREESESVHLRNVFVTTSLTVSSDSDSPEKSPLRSSLSSLKAGLRFFSYLISNLGRLNLRGFFSSWREAPLRRPGWRTSLCQLVPSEKTLSLRLLTLTSSCQHLGGRRGAPCRLSPRDTGDRSCSPA